MKYFVSSANSSTFATAKGKTTLADAPMEPAAEKKVFKKRLENLHGSKNGRNFASLLAQKQNGSKGKTKTVASERREIIEIFAKRKILTNANALEKQGNKEPSLSSRFRMTG